MEEEGDGAAGLQHAVAEASRLARTARTPRSRSARPISTAWRRGLSRSTTLSSACEGQPPQFAGRARSRGARLRWQALPARREALQLRADIARSLAQAEELIERATRLAELADDFVEETEFGFLFDRERQLFSIGFSVTDGRLDGSYYDTLASEARLASFVAIATGQIPHEHWFKLGRSLTPTGSARALLSWSASMFEYLMPLLVMRAYPGTLLDETYRAVVERQIQYGTQRGVPWGISESAYNAQDLEWQLPVPRVRRARVSV